MFDELLNCPDPNESPSVKIQLVSSEKTFPTFPNAFRIVDHNNYDFDDPLTKVELSIIQLSDEIRSKNDWIKKSENREIIEKWKAEALENGFSEKEINYVFDQLAYYKILKKENMEAAFVDKVWRSDNLIDEKLTNELIKNTIKLENIPDDQKDWHVGSNNLVLNLIHPSLYCLVYGKSKKIENKSGKISAETIPIPDLENINSDLRIHYSKKYQWLPSEFNVEDNGTVHINSYVNNLHPIENVELYGTLEQIFEKFIPLFNQVLTYLTFNPPRAVQDIHFYDETKGRDGENIVEEEEEEEEDQDKTMADYYNTFKRIPVEPVAFEMPKLDERKIVDLKGSNLQVIVKMSSIELTPENPKYPGGTWHVEGMMNERIVATGIYYYSMDNIAESKLQFRSAVSGAFGYFQYDVEGVERVYGLKDEEPLNQYLGSLVAKPGRAIAFPNIYQHLLSPFELADKTKPGSRKILVFFLVDPSVRIPSTADILPQQEGWIEPTIRKFKLFENVKLDALNNLTYTMSLEEAKNYRLDLMKERIAYSLDEETSFKRPFSLCEH